MDLKVRAPSEYKNISNRYPRASSWVSIDFMTMSLATDNVKHTPNPNKWNVKNITLPSLIPGILLIVEGLIVIFIGINYFHLEGERLSTLHIRNSTGLYHPNDI